MEEIKCIFIEDGNECNICHMKASYVKDALFYVVQVF